MIITRQLPGQNQRAHAKILRDVRGRRFSLFPPNGRCHTPTHLLFCNFRPRYGLDHTQRRRSILSLTLLLPRYKNVKVKCIAYNILKSFNRILKIIIIILKVKPMSIIV